MTEIRGSLQHVVQCNSISALLILLCIERERVPAKSSFTIGILNIHT